MALIGQIRRNSWVLIILIGLGLGGFIIMDMFSGQQSVFGSTQFTLGKVAGQKLDWGEFNRTEQILYSGSGGDYFGRRDYLWNYFVEKALIEETAEELGLGVSKAELLDLEFGPNPSPIILQRFRDPATGQVNRQILNEYKTAIEDGSLATNSQFGPFWAVQEKEIVKERLQSKLNYMVSKAMYTPSWMVEMNHQDQNIKADFSYVHVPFSEVSDMDIEVSDSDYKAYLDANKNKYLIDEETRTAEFVVFDVLPTSADSQKIRQSLVKEMEEFRTTDDDSSFVEVRYGSIDVAYVKKSTINPDIADTLFNAPTGSVIGPYIEGRNYKVVKLLDRKLVPDSVQARHILRRVNNPGELAQVQKTVDSLKTLIENGTHTFDSLARVFGTDGTAASGGDLGYAASGQMVKPFNDLIFFTAEEEKLYTVTTQFGVHLVEVTGRKYETNEEGVQVAYLVEAIEPSDDTQKAKFNDVLAFVSENRDLATLSASADTSSEIELEAASALKQNDYIVGSLGTGNSSRDIIRWLYSSDAEVGKVSPNIYVYQDPVGIFESKYVVVGLKGIRSANSAKLDDLRDEITPTVNNQKKGELIKAEIKGKDLAAVAAQYSTQIDTASNVAFSLSNVQGLGNEPKVIAAAMALDANSQSEPIVGQNGVYLVKVLSKIDAPATPNVAQLRKFMDSSKQGQVANQLMESIKKNADIQDYRSNFY
ncbi:MAG: peptidylprolyl isomerase [Bacteroidota bacterium]